MDHFEDVNEGIRATARGIERAGQGLELAAQGIIEAAQGMQRTIDAASRAREEHEDLRTTVQRLEALVMELVERMPPKEGGPQ